MDKTTKMKLDDFIVTSVGAIAAVLIKIPVPPILIDWANRVSEWLTVEGMPILQGLVGAFLVQVVKELTKEVSKSIINKGKSGFFKIIKKKKKDGDSTSSD